MGTGKRTGVKPIHRDKHFRKDGNDEYWGKVRTKFRNEISSLEPCDWCKRIFEITDDNYLLGVTMFDDGVEDNCKCDGDT